MHNNVVFFMHLYCLFGVSVNAIFVSSLDISMCFIKETQCRLREVKLREISV